ncbi:ABC transporter ATP-binding protein [bacterium]|nr:ABC transporter ATP-binding protein [bacterium]
MINLIQIQKRYGRHTALTALSRSFPATGIFGLVGPNGAGKSTLLRILTGQLVPTSGDIQWNGESVFESPSSWLRRVGYCPDIPALANELTVEEQLSFGYLLKTGKDDDGFEAVTRVLDAFDLQSVRHSRCGSLSHGYRQRVSIAQTFIHSPEVAVLDEPTQGLDPEQIVRFRDYLVHKALSTCIILSSHHLAEINKLPATVIAMFNGSVTGERETTHSDIESWYLTVQRGH